MASSVDVTLIEVEVVLDSSKVVIKSLDSEFFVNELSFEKRLRVIFVKEESS